MEHAVNIIFKIEKTMSYLNYLIWMDFMNFKKNRIYIITEIIKQGRLLIND